MADRHAALFHDFLEVPVAQRVGRIPADATQDYVDRKAHSFKVEHVDLSWIRHRSLSDRPAPFANATELEWSVQFEQCRAVAGKFRRLTNNATEPTFVANLQRLNLTNITPNTEKTR